MKKAKVHEAILNCDVWINVPILKNHGGANLTISMKNHMGIVWDRGFSIKTTCSNVSQISVHWKRKLYLMS